jgi:hypothetical protein
VPEVQTLICRATGGSMTLSFDGRSFVVPATATGATLRAQLMTSLGDKLRFVSVAVTPATGSGLPPVTYTPTKDSVPQPGSAAANGAAGAEPLTPTEAAAAASPPRPLCAASGSGNLITVRFLYPNHALISTAGAAAGDMPAIGVDGSTLTHPLAVIVGSAFTELVRGRRCVPLSAPYSADLRHQVKTDLLSGGGSVQFSFQGATTPPIDAAAGAAEVEAALEDLSSIVGVTVLFSGPQLCARPQNVAQLYFNGNFGNLPNLLVSADLGPGGAVSVVGDGVTLGGVKSIAGSKEDAECAGRGLCDTTAGTCECYTYFASSDGYGREGDRGDCGATTTVVSACPGEIACSGHGSCSGPPSHRCDCSEGWRGGDCGERACPSDREWFGFPSGDDAAHSNRAECSGRGVCDRSTGDCTCQVGFLGAACELLDCPLKCSGRGRCLSLAERARRSLLNGDAAEFEYGSVPNDARSWDAHRIFGCVCDPGFTGAACELRECAATATATGRSATALVLPCARSAGSGPCLALLRPALSPAPARA